MVVGIYEPEIQSTGNKKVQLEVENFVLLPDNLQKLSRNPLFVLVFVDDRGDI